MTLPIDPTLAIALGLLLGAIVGSFLATVIRRAEHDESALKGRSACEACGRKLEILELIPVLSHLVQRGRCRGCSARISREHLAVELAALAIGGGAMALFPDLRGATLALTGWLLLGLGWLDVRYRWLPDSMTAAVAILGIIAAEGITFVPLADRLLGGAIGFAVLAFIRSAYARAKGHEGMGAGDPKLMGAIGLWTGWAGLAPVLLVGSSGLVALAVLTGRHREEGYEYPLGSGLAAAGAVMMILLAVRAA
ncbi:prepilin peptidase [Sphingomicrobium sediminis]|uniref:Prepilin leader peptidase/N-methyltransferase n=1 Tax=Sphingomicrobium sediminis TaxID=2950949 RepID=A0A9X2EHL2_9SPHN|nr:A24 family peptidase [Sphingomicrobium sediminis]MCM8558193.1 A24 family peptidase [Sphingomicrobium sediminis]